MTEQWLSIVEYAKKHDISDMTVRRRIRAGKIDAELREGKYFIRVEGSGQPAVPSAEQVTDARRQPAGVLRSDRHLEQLLERDGSTHTATGRHTAVGAPPTASSAPPAELRYNPSSETGYSRPKPPAIPVRPSAEATPPPQAPPQTPPSQQPPQRAQGDRRMGDRRRQSRRRDDFSYPELDLAGTRPPASGLLQGSQNIEVQLSQLAAKLDHISQPWQQELLTSLKSELKLKDDKIRQLQQKIADLEMIIQMLDAKGSALSDPKEGESAITGGMDIPPGPPKIIPGGS